jgi:O-Antigen ligase
MRSAAGLSLLGAAGVLLTVSSFFGGGSGQERMFWIAAGAVLVALAATTSSLAGFLPAPTPGRLGMLALGLLLGFVAWNGISIWWSVAPDRSWDYLNRGIAYAALTVVGLYLGALTPRPARTAAAGLCLLLGAVLLWGLAGKVIPALFPDGARVARLRNPVGYWNSFALLADMALPLYLWLAARRRELGALGVYATTVALLLTYSRGGAVVAIVAVALWLKFGAERLESLRALAVAVPVGLGVTGIALALPGVAKDLQPHSVRVRDGALFGVALVIGAIAVDLLARRDVRRRELQAMAAVTVALVAVGVGALAAKGGWLEGFRRCETTQVAQGPSRLGSACSDNRWIWWKEAWRVTKRAPLAGKGAGAFAVARTRVRHNALVTQEPHNIALQALAETGVIGLLLGGAAALAALGAAVGAVRRLEGREHAAGVALAIAMPAYLLHALADIDWDFVAATAPAFFVLGVLIGSAAPVREPRSRPVLAMAAAAVTLASLCSLTFPWLAARRVNDSYDALGRGDLSGAVSAARDAHDLDPLSLDPYQAWALADIVAGDRAGAIREYRRAADRQPENSETWYDLGAYEFNLERYQAAYRDLNHAYTLDPRGPVGRKGDLLDQARAKVNAGAR